jgi:hypothetical protein
MLAAFVALTLGMPASLAYVLSDGRWRDGTATFHVAMPGTAPNGLAWKDAFVAAMTKWNATPFRFVVDDRYVDPCAGYTRHASGTGFPAGNGNARNSIDFRADLCGNTFGDDVLATTLNLSEGGSLGFDHIVESDIVFNTEFDWSIYNGPRRSRVDFGRVALHELGHTLGLGHELTEAAIMAPKLGDLDGLAADDIAGANRLYGAPTTCPIVALTRNSYVRDALQAGDCRIQQLYGQGDDTSLVDTYRLDLDAPATLRLRMSSVALDSVLLVTNLLLQPVEIFDDSAGSCNVDAQLSLPAGSYLLLANTYVRPEKCAGNTGTYQLQISDSPFPLLGTTGNTRSGGNLATALFSGRARLDSSSEARSSFAATDRITVEGRINPDPAHVGQPGRLFVLAVLSNGLQFMQNAAGQFVTFPGLGRIEPAARVVLQESEALTLVQGLRGSTMGLSGLGFQVFLGYALDSAPTDIHYGTQPIAFSIAP